MSRVIEGESGQLYRLDDREGEPVLSRLVVTAVAGLLLSIATRYGLPLQQGQADAIALVLVTAGPIVGAVWARRKAWSGASVHEVLTHAQEAARRE